MLEKIGLLIDGSVDPKLKIGFGAYLLLDKNDPSVNIGKVEAKKFEETTSTKLELQTLLWALTELEDLSKKVIVYTDSQNIVSLPGRRKELEQSDFISTKGKRLKNYQLYREFFAMMARMDCEFVKVKGHASTVGKDQINKLFEHVDRTARKALRNFLQSMPQD